MGQSIFTQALYHELDQFLKRSTTASNSEFFFSQTTCLTKTREPTLPHYLTVAVAYKWIQVFHKSINAKKNANSFSYDLNTGHRFHFLQR